MRKIVMMLVSGAAFCATGVINPNVQAAVFYGLDTIRRSV